MNQQITEPVAEGKVLATLTARLALKGFCLRVVADGPNGDAYRVSGGGLRTFDSVHELTAFCDRMESAS